MRSSCCPPAIVLKGHAEIARKVGIELARLWWRASDDAEDLLVLAEAAVGMRRGAIQRPVRRLEVRRIPSRMPLASAKRIVSLPNLESSPPPVLRAAEGDVPVIRVEALDNVLQLAHVALDSGAPGDHSEPPWSAPPVRSAA